jgi:hypothetical protein
VQPTLFELKEDSQPAIERTPDRRYCTAAHVPELATHPASAPEKNLTPNVDVKNIGILDKIP